MPPKSMTSQTKMTNSAQATAPYAKLPAPPPRSSVSCHICGSTRNHTYLEARGYRLAECDDCRLWFVNPQPTTEELARFYATYDEGEQPRFREDQFNTGIRDIILRYRRQGAVLDVGCATGNFLLCMRNSGFSVFGVEPSTSNSAYSRTQHGIETFNGTIEQFLATEPARRFDLITILNVFEHLTQPKQVLEALRELLTPNGLLVVCVPDARFHAMVGGIRRRLGIADPYWIQDSDHLLLSGIRFPEHLCSFQPRTISLLVHRCGFEIKSVRNAPVIRNAQFHRSLAKAVVRSIFDLVYYATFGRVVFGYSTVVVAQKS